MMYGDRVRSVTAALAIVLLGACATRTAQSPPANECVVSAAIPGPTVSIGILQNVIAGSAPVPRTSSERLVFRQLYQTLVTVDCNGTVVPLLAERWEASEQGSIWQFRIRQSARFWDGSAVTARDIAENWALRSDTILPIDGITVLGERELRVTLRAPIAGVERFADPALAITRQVTGGWPLGTGPYRPEPGATPRMLRVSGVDPAAMPRSIEFRTIGIDPRAALDNGMDGVVTADPSALAYARALRNYSVTPIGWSRTYVLATRGTQRSDSLSASVMEADIALVREAVRAETQPANGSYWWQRPECGPSSFSPVRMDTRNRNVVYSGSDPIARAIAERLVALAWPVSRAPAWLRAQLGNYSTLGSPAALGVDERTLAETARTGRALAVVTSLPRTAAGACFSSNDAITTALLGAWRVSALLDAREYLVHRAGIGLVSVDGDGVIRFGAAR